MAVTDKDLTTRARRRTLGCKQYPARDRRDWDIEHECYPIWAISREELSVCVIVERMTLIVAGICATWGGPSGYKRARGFDNPYLPTLPSTPIISTAF